jgi:hypothetical protein
MIQHRFFNHFLKWSAHYVCSSFCLARLARVAGVAGIRIYIVADVTGLCPAIMRAVRSAEDEREGGSSAREWLRRATQVIRCSWALPHGEVPHCLKHPVLIEVVHHFGAQPVKPIGVIEPKQNLALLRRQ